MIGTASGLTSLPERGSLREQVVQAIRAAIVSSEMAEGVVYSAPALAARFEVSATPVREALLDLAKEGLVEPLRNKGFRVTVVSEADLDEIHQLRTLLEVPGVGQVARSITAEEVTELRTLAALIEAALEAGDILGYLEADRLFHLALLGLTGNQRLVDIVGTLRSQTRMYNLHRVAEQGGLALSLEEHSGLLDRLAASDADGAEEVMRRHLRHIRFSWAGGDDAQ